MNICYNFNGENMKRRNIVLKLLLLFIWLTFIFFMSNQNGSQSNELTNSIIYNFFKLFNLSDSTIEILISNLFFIIRKLAHFTEYFILGILFMNLFKEFNIVSKKKLIYCCLLCLLYAISDEFHQLFIGSRNGSIIDVLIDFIGSISGVLIYKLVQTKITLSKR